MQKHILMAHRHHRQLTPIRVCGEIFQSVQLQKPVISCPNVKTKGRKPKTYRSAQQSKRLILIQFLSTGSILPTKVYALLKCTSYQRFGGIPPTLLIRDIILHTGAGVDFQFTRLHGGMRQYILGEVEELTYIDGRTQLGVVFSCVFAFAVPFGVVDVFDLCKR